MSVAKETIEHVKRWEGLRLEAYPDPGSKDGTPWSIGYGHTSDRFMTVRDETKLPFDHRPISAARRLTSPVIFLPSL